MDSNVPLIVCNCMKPDKSGSKIGLFVKTQSLPQKIRDQPLAVPLQSLHYNVQIVQNVARVELQQCYRNISSTFLEAEYFMPVRTNACVSDFRAEFGGKIVYGVVKEKEEARLEYQEHLKRGDLVAYSEVKEETPDVMKILLGNIPPQGDVNITFVYVEELEVSVNKFWKFTLPSTISPRYCNTHKPDFKVRSAEDAADKAMLERMPQSGDNLYSWQINVTITQNSPIEFIRSPSHAGKDEQSQLKLQYKDSSHHCASFEVQGLPNKDFILLFKSADIAVPKAVLGQAQDGRKLCALVSFVPDIANAANLEDAYLQQLQSQDYMVELDTAANEFIFLLDCSGSIEGQRIKQAKTALITFIQILPPGSFFNIVSFGIDYKQLFQSSKLNEKDVMQNAIEIIQKFDANMGGTEINEPLLYIFKQPKQMNMPRQIFLLTDGGVSNTQQVIDIVGKHRKLNRLHTIGIGSGVSEYLVKKCAHFGGGKSIFVNDGGNLKDLLQKLLKSVLTPYLDKFQFNFDKQIVDSIVPSPHNMGPILKNEPFKVAGDPPLT